LVSLSIEYPTSSVRVQYTTESVGFSSADRNRSGKDEKIFAHA